jgi:FMN-dependent NADH-azoreductase
VLGFLGMTDLHFVYAEGLAMGAEAERKGVAAALEEIEEVVKGTVPISA